MNFWQFTFSFLYVRNWHTGHLELSRPRTAIFMTGLFLIMFGFALTSIMRTPLHYVNPASATSTTVHQASVSSRTH